MPVAAGGALVDVPVAVEPDVPVVPLVDVLDGVVVVVVVVVAAAGSVGLMVLPVPLVLGVPLVDVPLDDVPLVDDAGVVVSVDVVPLVEGAALGMPEVLGVVAELLGVVAVLLGVVAPRFAGSVLLVVPDVWAKDAPMAVTRAAAVAMDNLLGSLVILILL